MESLDYDKPVIRLGDVWDMWDAVPFDDVEAQLAYDDWTASEADMWE